MVVVSNFSAANPDLADISAGPVDAVYGWARGLPWTYGTTENLTVQAFEYNETDELVQRSFKGASAWIWRHYGLRAG